MHLSENNNLSSKAFLWSVSAWTLFTNRTFGGEPKTVASSLKVFFTYATQLSFNGSLLENFFNGFSQNFIVLSILVETEYISQSKVERYGYTSAFISRISFRSNESDTVKVTKYRKLYKFCIYIWIVQSVRFPFSRPNKLPIMLFTLWFEEWWFRTLLWGLNNNFFE